VAEALGKILLGQTPQSLLILVLCFAGNLQLAC
jgi:hypothetical protein